MAVMQEARPRVVRAAPRVLPGSAACLRAAKAGLQVTVIQTARHLGTMVIFIGAIGVCRLRGSQHTHCAPATAGIICRNEPGGPGGASGAASPSSRNSQDDGGAAGSVPSRDSAGIESFGCVSSAVGAERPSVLMPN